MYLLSTYSVPGTVLDAENKAVNKGSKDACLCGACLLGGRQAGKETDDYKRKDLVCDTGGVKCCQWRQGTRGKDKRQAAVLNKVQERPSHLVEKVTFE